MSQDPMNPYAASDTPASINVSGDAANSYPTCPFCQAKNAKKVGFTWWRGVLGPALLKVVKCQSCKSSFSGKSGKPLTTAIAVYMIVGLVIGVVLGVVLVMSGG